MRLTFLCRSMTIPCLRLDKTTKTYSRKHPAYRKLGKGRGLWVFRISQRIPYSNHSRLLVASFPTSLSILRLLLCRLLVNPASSQCPIQPVILGQSYQVVVPPSPGCRARLLWSYLRPAHCDQGGVCQGRTLFARGSWRMLVSFSRLLHVLLRLPAL